MLPVRLLLSQGRTAKVGRALGATRTCTHSGSPQPSGMAVGDPRGCLLSLLLPIPKETKRRSPELLRHPLSFVCRKLLTQFAADAKVLLLTLKPTVP